MIIGFTQRSQTVSEGARDNPLGFDFNRLCINVATERTSERVHTIRFRYLESGSTAIVENNIVQRNPQFDALFGNEDNDPIEEIFELQPGESDIPCLVTSVRNDFRPETDECYTIGIFPVDDVGYRELLSCNGDEEDPTDLFCLHTICILNDDGRFI